VSYLTEELVRMGHEVCLFASGDSRTSARLVAVCPQGLREAGSRDPLAYQVLQMERVFEDVDRFDVLHFHVDHLQYPLARRCGVPYVTTMHGRLDMPETTASLQEFREAPLVSISDAQRLPVPWAHWVATVHHGLPRELYGYRDRPEGYVAFLGRISPEKRVDRAVEIAEKAGVDLRIAATVDPKDQRYFEEKIEPLLKGKGVEYLGEVDERGKSALLGGARALVFPVDWPEPFGMVMIEAMACGTPVIAFRNGSVEEVVTDGVTGFVVEDCAGAVKAVERLDEISRGQCRAEFERRFTVDRMARDYLGVYERVRSSHGSETR